MYLLKIHYENILKTQQQYGNRVKIINFNVDKKHHFKLK